MENKVKHEQRDNKSPHTAIQGQQAVGHVHYAVKLFNKDEIIFKEKYIKRIDLRI